MSESLDEDDEFFFESDHLALKENKDYRALLKTILTLQVQRTQAIQDIDKIHDIQKAAIEDPIAFVEKLNKGENIGVPPVLQLQELPSIDWSKYEHVMPKEANRPFTRLKRINRVNLSHGTSNADDSTSDDGSKVLIRGRAFDDSKPETFNQLWTPEEQKRLEELLVEHPPEEIESRRWKKIADALGNRTSKQVQSRVQKYFKKLHLAGLPVPGRIPRVCFDLLRKSHKHQRNNHLLLKPSTFFPALDPPVLMSDDLDEASGFNSNNDSSQGYPDDNTDESVQQPAVPASQHSELLAMVIKEKEKTGSQGEHEGYSCDCCGEQPLQGTRWHCVDCAVHNSFYDLCSDCLAAQLLGDNGDEEYNVPRQHGVHHRFRPIHSASHEVNKSSAWDPDYLASSSSYNYLDPNFMPD